MTELQGGKFEIDIDGDLFKVRLEFPVIKADEITAPSESGSDADAVVPAENDAASAESSADNAGNVEAADY